MPPSSPVQSVDAALRVIGFEHIADVSSAQTYTVPAGARLVYIDAGTQNVRWRADGVDPTATIGGRVIADTGPVVLPLQEGEVLRLIEEASAATVDITVFGNEGLH